MVEGEGEIDHRPDGNGVVADDGALLDCSHAENRDLGLMDDGRPEQAAEAARIGEGECPALDLLHAQALRAGPAGQVFDGARDAQEILFVGVFDDGDDQAGLQRHRHADVHVAPVNDVRALDRRIQNREFLNGFDGRAEEKRCVGEL